ncbi:MAG: hypothetical protein IJ009_04575 [Clostridia bacterium]|nr:hypothetical protein [Clostridia bacterium]
MSKRVLSLILACVMLALAVPVLALPAFAEEVDLFVESFNQETDITVSEDARSSPGTILHLYTWYKADGTAKPLNRNDAPLEDTDYAVYNPELIDRGIISANDDYETVIEKYYNYLYNAARFTYKGNWTIGTYQADGSYAPSEQRVFTYNQWWYGARIAGGGSSPHVCVATASWESQFGTSLANATVYLDSFIAIAYDENAVQPGEDGKIYWSELAELYDISNATLGANGAVSKHPAMNQVYTWNKDSGSISFQKNKPNSEVKLMALRPSSVAPAAYNYKVPAGVVGTAKLSIADFADYNEGAGAKLAIALNGEVVWPVGAVISDVENWYNYVGTGNISGFADGIADLTVDVKPNDNVAILVARTSPTASGPILDMQPTISIERKYTVEYKDAEGELLSSYVAAKGDALPKAPFAAAAEGWIINGTAATELPATVTDNLVIEYAGEPIIADTAVESVSISIASSFAINVYLKADDYAVKAGLADDDGNEYWGVEQADGTFKVTMPGFLAKEMDRELNLWLFQEFDGENAHDSADPYALVPTEVLAAYADSDASDAEKALAAAALDYADAAKAYFAGEALDSEVAARLAAQDAAIAAIESNVEIADSEEYFVSGMTLVLKDQVMFKIRVSSSMYEPMAAETLDYFVAVEGQGTENEYTGFVYVEESEEYDITMTLGAVTAADFDESFKFTVKDASFAVSETFEYSVNDYIARTFDANAKEADLLRAIYALGVAANNA